MVGVGGDDAGLRQIDEVKRHQTPREQELPNEEKEHNCMEVLGVSLSSQEWRDLVVFDLRPKYKGCYP